MISSREAAREGTGRPLPSWWVLDVEVENPSPPAVSPARSSSTMASTSAAVANSEDRSPITVRRMAEWPTRNPVLAASGRSVRSRYSAVVPQFQSKPVASDSAGMPSTRASMASR